MLLAVPVIVIFTMCI